MLVLPVATGVRELGGTDTLEAARVEGFGATHFVHTVEVIVLRIVETVNELCTIWVLPDVTVFVTGQVVRVVTTLQHC